MQPLRTIALFIGGLPLAVFLATLFLTDGAPLKSLAPGEESGPVAVTRALPPAALERPTLERSEEERHGSVTAAGLNDTEMRPEPADQDPKMYLFMTLFGLPDRNSPDAP
jgi:hypothetical protein